MTTDMLITLGALLTLLVGVTCTRAPLDIAMVTILAILMTAGVVEPAAAFAGFSNPAILMIGALYVVATGMRETGAINRWAPVIMGRPKTLRSSLFRLTTPVAVLSGFMNNTPLVAMFMPVVVDLGRRLKISASKLLMPLSFASILGGQLTVVGTASNLVVEGLYGDWLEATPGSDSAWALDGPIAFFAPASYGLIAMVLGIIFMVLFTPALLPSRTPTENESTEQGGYEAQMVIQANGPLVGRSIEDAGLRHLRGLYLASIERNERVLSAVGPEEVLQAGDVLGFVGDAEGVVDLRRIPGFATENNQVEKVDVNVTIRRMIEAVVAPEAPFIGNTVRESKFRTVYNAAIVGVRRQGSKLEGRIGDIVLKAGDVLLLEASSAFIDIYGQDKSFHLVSIVEDSQPPRHERAFVSLAVLLLMISGLVTGILSPVLTAWLAAIAMVAFRCTSTSQARSSIDFSVLVTIGAAIGVGSAIGSSGLGTVVGEGLVNLTSSLGGGSNAALASIIIATMVVSQLATNYGGAVILFPIAMSTATALGASPIPFMIAVMAGAGSNFLTPLTYQTNLMVYGPGHYQFTDYARLGIGLQLIVLVTASVCIPWFFPL